MNSPKRLLESKKFILLHSIILSLIFIVIFNVIFNSQNTSLEIIITSALSLIGGPYAILGFIIAEIGYALIFNPQNMIPISITCLIVFTSNIVLWKLWYSIMNKYGYEIPNLSRLYTLIKFLIIFLIYYIIIGILFNGFIKGNMLHFDLWDIMIPASSLNIIIAIFAIHLFNKFKIPLYTPKIQFKQYLPKKAYPLLLVCAIIIGLANAFVESNPDYSLLISFLIVFCLLIYIIEPFNEKVYKIKGNMDLNIFNKINISLFLILIIITSSITIPLYFYVEVDPYLILYDVSYVASRMFMLFLIPIIVYLYYLEKNTIKPINKLSKSLSKKISAYEEYEELKNNLNSINTQNELKTLADSLVDMENDLMNYHDKLIEVTAQKERFKTELQLGHDIQNSMIPKDFEEFNKNKNCEVWALTKPAREVCGDFYDYFQIDENNIGLVIGDVAGKGITASLIMVKAMTLIQDYANHYDDPSEVFYEVNNLLCEGNAENIFTSCWFGKLNLKTKELDFVNAGHNPPLINQNNAFEHMATTPGLVLGIMEDMSYDTCKIQLKENDEIFLFTDGVTEANNNYNGFYGEERLQDILNKNKDDSLKNIISTVENDMSNFCNNQEQFDDITMLIIRILQ